MEATNNTRRLHPLLTAAAVSVIVFSGVGIAAITGVLPTSKGSAKEETPVAAQAPAAPVAEAPKAEAPRTESMPAPRIAATPAPRPAKKHVHVARAETSAPAPAPAPQAYEPAPAPYAQAPQPAVKPGLLGTVELVRQVEEKGDAKGVGAVGGGVAGAVLGHNIGDHNKLVTILGAAGGALLGNQIEKQARATKHWELTVRYDNGTTETFKSPEQPFWHQGDRVRLFEGKLQPV